MKRRLVNLAVSDVMVITSGTRMLKKFYCARNDQTVRATMITNTKSEIPNVSDRTVSSFIFAGTHRDLGSGAAASLAFGAFPPRHGVDGASWRYRRAFRLFGAQQVS
jgi:hypothetical protein